MSTKADTIAQIAAALDMSNREATDVFNAVTDVLTVQLQNEGVANLGSLGKLKVVERAERTGRNPQTGEPLIIKARKAIKFSASAATKEIVQ